MHMIESNLHIFRKTLNELYATLLIYIYYLLNHTQLIITYYL